MMPEEVSPMEKKQTLAQELIAGFTGLADALEAGGELGPEFNCYRMQLDLKPHSYSKKMVRATRNLLGASQSVFATFLGVSVKTVSQWEQGLGCPQSIACRFMDEINLNPEYYRQRLRNSVVPKSGERKRLVKSV
jgi:putative transcriptional regulator